MGNLNINIKELIDSLSPADLILLASNMKGDGTGSLLRFTGTISKNATKDEMRRFMEINLKMREGALNNWEPPEDTGVIEDDFRKVLELVKPQQDVYLKLGNVREDKFEELIQVGKFVVHIGGMTLETHDPPQDFPDFIVRRDSLRIGIEHTRLIDGSSNAVYNRIKWCIEKAEELLHERFPDQTGIINLSINEFTEAINGKDFGDQSICTEERIALAALIADYLSTLIDTSLVVAKPAFITKAFLSGNPGIPIGITLAQTYLPEKDSETAALIMERIAGKEKKYGVTASAAGFAELWLLIVVEGVKFSSGFKLSESVLPTLATSRFNKIYVFDSFSYLHFLIFEK